MKKCFNNIINDDPFADFDEKEKELETLMIDFLEFFIKKAHIEYADTAIRPYSEYLEEFLSQKETK